VRILQLGPYPPPHGGVQTTLVSIHRALLARGAVAMVANITSTRRREADGVYYPRNALELLWMLVRLRPDVVHLHLGGNLSARLLALCAICAIRPRTRAVVTFHSGGYASSPAGQAARARSLTGFVFRRFDRIIAVNGEIVELFRRLGVNAESVRLIAPHAVDPSVLAERDPRATLPVPIREFYASHDQVLLTVGLLEPEYDLDLQLKLLPLLRRVFPRAGLIIVGSGSLHGDLERKIASSPVADHILLCGDVPHEHTMRMIATSDVLLRTTLYDGDSVAVREALCFGTPVVATDNGMRPSTVRLFPVGDLDALASATTAVLRGGRAAAPSRTDGGSVDAVLSLYEELVAPARIASQPVLTVE
jgi:glycosyltransferase involved in cell wall biosynthesis